MFAKKLKWEIRGTVVVDRRTKNVIKRIKQGQIAVICHEDIDEMAARDLVNAKVKAVINTARSMTGSYPSTGAKILLHYQVPLFDCLDDGLLLRLTDGNGVAIKNNALLLVDGIQYSLRPITVEEIESKWQYAQTNIENRLQLFIENTLAYAQKEKNHYIDPLPHVATRIKIHRKHVLIVVRGKHYREDLRSIRSYIEDYSPILIGVDGGADALLEEGWKPDIIIGDMDSVSDSALRCGAEIIVHAYPNGYAPAKSRLDQLDVNYQTLPATGTSEDVAMLYAYEQGAEWIVALGAHSNMIDFLEKGRKGMASTVLVRMKVGTKLIDAKGVSVLYQKKANWKNLIFFSSAAAFPVLIGSALSPVLEQLWNLFWLQIKLLIE